MNGQQPCSITNSKQDKEICEQFAQMCRRVLLYGKIDSALIRTYSKLFWLQHTISPLLCKLEDTQPRIAIRWVEDQMNTYRTAWITHNGNADECNRRSAAICRLFLRELHRYHQGQVNPPVKALNPLASLEQRRAQENRLYAISHMCEDLLREDLTDTDNLAQVVENLVLKSLSQYADNLKMMPAQTEGERTLVMQQGNRTMNIVLTVKEQPC